MERGRGPCERARPTPGPGAPRTITLRGRGHRMPPRSARGGPPRSLHRSQAACRPEVVPEVYGCLPHGDGIEMAGDIPLITLQRQEINELRGWAKRSLDIAIAISTLLALAPALAVIALLVKLDSPGPALYRAPRVGEGVGTSSATSSAQCI